MNKQTETVTCLGEFGATFSHQAYNVLAGLYGAPAATSQNYLKVNTNAEVLGKIAEHGGYGVIAMETDAEARIDESHISFMCLLNTYTGNEHCPFHVAGAIRMTIHFCLMVRPGVSRSSITKIISHVKGLGACKARIAGMGIPTMPADNNGEAARLVAEDPQYATCAALGPRCAAEKYGLVVLENALEDKVAITTFYLIAPKTHRVALGTDNRILIVFRLKDTPKALVKALDPIGDGGFNLRQINSIHIGNHTYNFGTEANVGSHELCDLEKAVQGFKENAGDHLVFGPFRVVEV